MTDITERQKLAHEGARDTVKHLITLSTASIGVLIAIFKDLIGVSASDPAPTTLWLSVILFGVSALSGALSLQCLTGNLEKRSEISIYAGNVVVFTGIQSLCFVIALVLAGISVAYK